MDTTYMQSRWNGKNSIEIAIPELKHIAFLTFIETVCIGISTVILFVSVMVFFLSYGFERSDLGAILFAGAALVSFLFVVVLADIKLNKFTKIVDKKFNDSIYSQLLLTPLDEASVAHKRSGYMYLTDGSNVTMWEIYYYPDEGERITLERYIPENMKDASGDDSSKAA